MSFYNDKEIDKLGKILTSPKTFLILLIFYLISCGAMGYLIAKILTKV